jgi:asparagine synthase (glutamine-hydrolysing)
MASNNEQYCLVYNGEVYNYRELRAELAALGHTFKSSGDTEVVLRACMQWGAAAFTKFVGMFALVFIDRVRRRLFLARDPFGIKPLFYWYDDQSLVFSSEIPSVMAHPATSRRADASAVFQYLSFGVSEHPERTFFEGVRKVRPGHWVEVSLHSPLNLCRQAPYCDGAAPRTRTRLSLKDAAEELRCLMVATVDAHLRSDVPVGVMVSGGLDSSSLLFLMRERAGKSADIQGFSYVARAPGMDEEMWIDLATQRSRVTSHKLTLTETEFRNKLGSLVRAQGEPFGSTRIAAQFAVYEKVREAGIKVVVSGQGADELFAGYESYLPFRLLSLSGEGRWGEAIGLVSGVRRRRGSRGVAELLMRALDASHHDRLSEVGRRLVGRNPVPPWVNQAWLEETGAEISVPPDRRHVSGVREALDQSVQSSLTALLRYEDRNSMISGVESRVPFLTGGLLQFGQSLPDEVMLPATGPQKLVLREAMRGVVPDELLDRRDKIGFETPEADWLRPGQAWVEDLLGGDVAASIPVLDLPRLRRLWSRSGHRRAGYDWRFWRCLCLIMWTAELGVTY